MALTQVEKSNLMLASNRIAATALTIASLLAANDIVRAGSTAVALRAEIDAWLDSLSAEASD